MKHSKEEENHILTMTDQPLLTSCRHFTRPRKLPSVLHRIYSFILNCYRFFLILCYQILKRGKEEEEKAKDKGALSSVYFSVRCTNY